VSPLCRCLSRFEPHALAVGYRRGTRLWGMRAAAHTTVRPVVNPLSGFGSLPEFHPYITVNQSVIDEDRAGSHLPRSPPLQRFSATRSHLAPPGPIPAVALRPQGFAPSRRLAPLMASRAYSIPVPLMGFYPSRLCSSPGAVRPFGRRVPRGFSSSLARRGRPSRDSHTKRSTSAGPGISQVTAANASLGFPASRLLARGSEGRSSRPFIPSRAFSARPQADRTAGASGFSLPQTQPLSLETG